MKKIIRNNNLRWTRTYAVEIVEAFVVELEEEVVELMLNWLD